MGHALMKHHSMLMSGVTLFVALATIPVQAGCPALPEKVISIQITNCRFYDATADKLFKNKVHGHYTKGWDDLPQQRISQLRSETLQRNTGAIIRGKVAGSKRDEDFFHLTRDRAICTQFVPSRTYEFSVQVTCPMVFFEAPTRKVITLPGGKAHR